MVINLFAANAAKQETERGDGNLQKELADSADVASPIDPSVIGRDSAAGRQYSTSSRRQSLRASNPPEAVSSSSSTIVARIDGGCGMHVLATSPYQVTQ
jgi:hypothetical protein